MTTISNDEIQTRYVDAAGVRFAYRRSRSTSVSAPV
jgi:hypothetical protein